MQQVLQRIRKSQIRVVVADREFIGQEWFAWLDTQNIPFAIRIKENAIVKSDNKEIPLKKLFQNLQIHQQTILFYDGHFWPLHVVGRIVGEWVAKQHPSHGHRKSLFRYTCSIFS